MRNLGIATKIYLIVALMAVVAGAVGSIGLSVLGTFMAEAEAMRGAASRALLGEQVNTLVTAVVMDSRGVYMARSPEEVEKFGKPLLANLERMEERLRQWEPQILPEQRPEFAKLMEASRHFIDFRRETVRIGREQGGEGARSFGDNDANRKSRQALNAALESFAKSNAGDITRQTEGLAATYAWARGLSLAVLVGGVQAVTANIADVESAAVDTGSSAQRVLSAAEQVSGQAGELRHLVSDFLARVKMA